MEQIASSWISQTANTIKTLGNGGAAAAVSSVTVSKNSGESRELKDLMSAAENWSSTSNNPVSPNPANTKEHMQPEKWLDVVQKNMFETAEWQSLTQHMYKKVQAALSHNNFQYFADLTEDEKILMIDDIEDAISNENVYQNFSKVLNAQLDKGLLDLVNANPEKNETKTKPELLVEYAAQGVSKMLGRIPSNISTVRLLLNQNIPIVLRTHVWGMILHDTEALNAYKSRVTSRRIATIAASDTEVTEKCQRIFETEFPNVADSSSLTMIGKTVLSYRVTAFGMVEDCQYYLIVPIILVFAKTYQELPRVVEALHALLGMKRPRYAMDGVKRIKLADTFSEMLRAADPQLHDYLITTLETEKSTDEFQEAANGKRRLLELVQSPIENLFVGTLSLECCQYVWDQCLLVGFDRLVLPFLVCIFILLREQLSSKKTFQNLQETLLHQSKSIEPSELSRQIEHRFMTSIRTEFGCPLRGMSHWKNDPVAPLKDLGIGHLPVFSEASVPDKEDLDKAIESEETVKARLEERLNNLYPPEAKEEENPPEEKEEEKTDEQKKSTTEEANDEGDLVSTGRKREPSSNNNGVVADIKLPFVHEKWNGFADTLRRTKLLNPEVDNDEDLKTAILTQQPHFQTQNPKLPVLKVDMKPHLAFFKTLQTGNPEADASEIVREELRRLGLDNNEDHIKKLAKHLIKYSKMKCKYDPNPTIEEKVDDDVGQDDRTEEKIGETKEEGKSNEVEEKEPEEKASTATNEVLKSTVLKTIEAIKTIKRFKRVKQT